MTSSVKVKVENVILISLYAYTYVCQILKHLIEPFILLSCSQKSGSK